VTAAFLAGLKFCFAAENQLLVLV